MTEQILFLGRVDVEKAGPGWFSGTTRRGKGYYSKRGSCLSPGLSLNGKGCVNARKSWEPTAKASRAWAGPNQAHGGRCNPWRALAGLGSGQWAGIFLQSWSSGPCVWEEALQLCNRDSSFPLPLRGESGGLPLWQIPLWWHPALLPDFWGSVAAPVFTISGLASVTIVPSCISQASRSHFLKPIPTLESNSLTPTVWGFFPLTTSKLLSAQHGYKRSKPSQVVIMTDQPYEFWSDL